MEEYFSHLDGQSCSDLYQLVMQEVEDPLLTAVMKYTRNNQSKASEMLGLNRGTLRKKLKLYDLL
ncbi:MAG: DNA-binding transcriptional regulator Fis [Gammaproteobacteria bacterium]|nr:DNA-binding transcriptional regulator Fis [Gammaproteobacteria bacterium]MBQ0840862.1 DNA-binding transcriptional regulator Fis [Gammaproteobacteria bacterium]